MYKALQKVAGVFGMVLATTLVVACSSPVTSSSSLPASVRSVAASEVPSLGAAASFAVFGGGAGITNQGIQTTIQGDIGTTGASTMLSGFHSASFVYIETPLNVGAVNGLVYTAAPQGSPADLVVAQACAADALTAFNNLAGLAGGIDPGAGQLGGLTLYSGVYKSAAGPFSITGSDLTLDAQGNPDAAWVFQMASALTVGGPAAPRSIILTGGAQAKNVFWQVGSAATINGAGGGSMVGTIIASSGITFSTPGNATATTLNGRALALFASVTMVNTIINAPAVAASNAGRSLALAAGQVSVSGITAADVAAVVSGGGYITVVNNGAHVAATQTGTGTINATNNGGVLTATNNGTGIMTITSNATGAVTVTNTGSGRVTVNATGAAAIAIVHTGNADFVYP